MKQNLLFKSFAVVLFGFMLICMGVVLEQQKREIKRLRATVTAQANEISEMMKSQGESSDIYVGLQK